MPGPAGVPTGRVPGTSRQSAAVPVRRTLARQHATCNPACDLPSPRTIGAATGHLGSVALTIAPMRRRHRDSPLRSRGTRVAEFRPRRRPAWTCTARTRRDRLAGHGDPRAADQVAIFASLLAVSGARTDLTTPFAARKVRETVSSPTVPEFGPNDWFLQERYQAFLADPASVDSIWRDFFAHTESSSDDSNPAAGHGIHATTSTISASALPPLPGSSSATISAASAAAPVSSDSPARPGRPVRPPPPPPPIRATSNAQLPTTGAGGGKDRDAPRATTLPTRPTITATPDDLIAVKAANAARAARDADGTDQTSAPLRGAAATVVRNMTSSLEVPTATTVRAVPAKLMADKRIVIKNFLNRNRGGKISFTHLIGCSSPFRRATTHR